MSDGHLVDEVRALAHLDLEGLRAEWRRRYGAPPKLRSVDLLRRLLAWRMQAEVFGGLDDDTRRTLRRPGAPIPKGVANRPTTGSTIFKEYGGRRLQVTVVEGGFIYEDAKYRSLSQIARAITGVRWNGPRFFGLRDAG